MTTTEWIEEARTHREVFVALVRNYHPASMTGTPAVMVITAPTVERARRVVAEGITSTEAPDTRLDRALTEGDIRTTTMLLNEAWFGVPESTACWGIPGFREACNLLEDPPED